MGILTKMLRQEASYWALVGFSQYGQPEYADPVEITCRWEDVNEEFIDAQGTRQMSHAMVYTDRDVTVGGVLMLGELESPVNEGDPKRNTGAWEIKRFDKLPTLKATKFLRTAYL